MLFQKATASYWQYYLHGVPLQQSMQPVRSPACAKPALVFAIEPSMAAAHATSPESHSMSRLCYCNRTAVMISLAAAAIMVLLLPVTVSGSNLCSQAVAIYICCGTPCSGGRHGWHGGWRHGWGYAGGHGGRWRRQRKTWQEQATAGESGARQCFCMSY